MPELIVKLGDSVVQRYVIDKDLISIGRAKDNDVVIENLSVSRNHARIRRQGNAYILTDLNSSNGTFVNNVRITKAEIRDGDVITIGKHHIVFVHKELSESDVIVEALGADRTMVIDRHETVGELCFTEGKLKGKTVLLQKSETTIGKAPTNDVVIADDWFLAKKQAIISRRGDVYEIRDQGTLRRTRVNGQPVSGTAQLRDGDIIEIGSEKCLFRLRPIEEIQAPTGRVPKELGLEDSIFASVSALPPELQPAAATPTEEAEKQARPQKLDESEDWSEIGRQIEAEAAVAPIEPLGVEDVSPALASRTFSAEEVAAEEAAFAQAPQAQEQKEEEPVAVQGPSQEAVSQAAPESPEHSGRLSRRKLRALQRQAKRAEEHIAAQPAPQEPAVAHAPQEEAPSATEPAPSEAAAESPKVAEPGKKLQLSVEEQVALWEAALKNQSPIIRRQAAKMLKKLTGKDYAY